jgi:hypothetical protein
VFIVIEVSTLSIEYEREHIPSVHPKNAAWYYGYSYMLAWTVFFIYLFAAIAFIACSRKRKRDRAGALSEDWGMDDEPHIIGR